MHCETTAIITATEITRSEYFGSGSGIGQGSGRE